MGFLQVFAACLWFIVFFSGTFLLTFYVGWIGVYIWWAANILLAISLNTAIRHSEPEAFDDRLPRERREVARERYIAEMLKPRQRKEAALQRYIAETFRPGENREERQEAAIQRYIAERSRPHESREAHQRRYVGDVASPMRRKLQELARSIRNRPYAFGVIWSAVEAILISTKLLLAVIVLWIFFGYFQRDLETSIRAFLSTQPLAVGLGIVLMYLESPGIFVDPFFSFLFLVGVFAITFLLGAIGSAVGAFVGDSLGKPE